jgi:NADPH2:quinone reductase
VPYVAGAEAVGRVLESDVHVPGTVVWTGMQGLGIDRDGVMAERALARDDGVVAVPEGADPALAAAMGIAGLAGWLPLEWRAPVRAGETVLVLGATGTLGLVAVQAAKLLGAGRVVAAGRRPEGLERARRAGADATVRIGDSDGLADELKEASGGDGPNLIVDPLWGAPLEAALTAAAPGARIVQIGQSAGAEAAVPSGAVRGKHLELLGYTNLRVPFGVLSAGYRRLVEHAAAGRIEIDLERVPLERAPEAWQRQAAGTDTKLVVVPG